MPLCCLFRGRSDAVNGLCLSCSSEQRLLLGLSQKESVTSAECRSQDRTVPPKALWLLSVTGPVGPRAVTDRSPSELGALTPQLFFLLMLKRGELFFLSYLFPWA